MTAYLQKSGLSQADIDKVTFVPAPPVNLAQLLKPKQLDAIFLEDIIKDKLIADGGARLLTTDYAQFALIRLCQLVICSPTASSHRTRTRCASSSKALRARSNGRAQRRAIRWLRV